MDRNGHDALPTVVADMENLQRQLRELHASVKAKTAERGDQPDSSVGGGMVIRGK